MKKIKASICVHEETPIEYVNKELSVGIAKEILSDESLSIITNDNFRNIYDRMNVFELEVIVTDQKTFSELVSLASRISDYDLKIKILNLLK